VALVVAPAALPGVPAVTALQDVELYGGPEDGALLWLPPGELPHKLGVHRITSGDLVPIRGRALVLELPALPVYQRAADVKPDRVLRDGHQVPVYVWAVLVSRAAGYR
jgi:hypothetical protein